MNAVKTMREVFLGVRLTPPERALIKQHAEREGRAESALVRHIVLSYLREQEDASQKETA